MEQPESQMGKMPIASLYPHEIINNLSLPQIYRGKQIFKWIQKGISSFKEMTNIPDSIKKILSANFFLFTSRITATIKDRQKTVKFRITLEDGNTIESVSLEEKDGKRTVCLSSQVGCVISCRFCKTGTMGFKRNLYSHEIIEQFLLLKMHSGKISNIVFMGMGEPLLNISNVKKAIEIINHPDGNNISLRKITISTCGIAEGIIALIKGGPYVRLAFSLITANENLRKHLIPASNKNPLIKIKKALIDYQKRVKKYITLEIVIMKGINDNEDEINRILSFIPPLKVTINIIPWNTVSGLPFKRPDSKVLHKIRKRFEESGITVTQRYLKGNSINAACGQLYIDEDNINF